MQFKPSSAKAMSESTRKMGEAFVKALLEEGHQYDSVKANYLSLVARLTAEAASKKLAETPGAVREKSGLIRGSVTEAARMLGLTRNRFSQLLGTQHL
jgi:hypothetical protein